MASNLYNPAAFNWIQGGTDTRNQRQRSQEAGWSENQYTGQFAGLGDYLADYSRTMFGQQGPQAGPGAQDAAQKAQNLTGSGFYEGQQQYAQGAWDAAQPSEDYRSIMDNLMNPESWTTTDRTAWTNPYQQDVIDTSLADMDEQTARQAANLQATLAGQSAFGTRSQIAQGLQASEADRARATLAANLRHQGYETAQQGFETEQNRNLQSQGQALQGDLSQRQLGITGAQAAAGIDATAYGKAMDALVQQTGISKSELEQRLAAAGFDLERIKAATGVLAQGTARTTSGGTKDATINTTESGQIPDLSDYLNDLINNPPGGNQPPPTGTQPPPTGTQPPPTGTQPPPTGTQPPPTGTQPPPTGTEPPPTGTQPPPTVEPTGPIRPGTDGWPSDWAVPDWLPEGGYVGEDGNFYDADGNVVNPLDFKPEGASHWDQGKGWVDQNGEPIGEFQGPPMPPEDPEDPESPPAQPPGPSNPVVNNGQMIYDWSPVTYGINRSAPIPEGYHSSEDDVARYENRILNVGLERLGGGQTTVKPGANGSFTVEARGDPKHDTQPQTNFTFTPAANGGWVVTQPSSRAGDARRFTYYIDHNGYVTTATMGDGRSSQSMFTGNLQGDFSNLQPIFNHYIGTHGGSSYTGGGYATGGSVDLGVESIDLGHASGRLDDASIFGGDDVIAAEGVDVEMEERAMIALEVLSSFIGEDAAQALIMEAADAGMDPIAAMQVAMEELSMEGMMDMAPEGAAMSEPVGAFHQEADFDGGSFAVGGLITHGIIRPFIANRFAPALEDTFVPDTSFLTPADTGSPLMVEDIAPGLLSPNLSGPAQRFSMDNEIQPSFAFNRLAGRDEEEPQGAFPSAAEAGDPLDEMLGQTSFYGGIHGNLRAATGGQDAMDFIRAYADRPEFGYDELQFWNRHGAGGDPDRAARMRTAAAIGGALEKNPFLSAIGKGLLGSENFEYERQKEAYDRGIADLTRSFDTGKALGPAATIAANLSNNLLAQADLVDPQAALARQLKTQGATAASSMGIGQPIPQGLAVGPDGFLIDERTGQSLMMTPEEFAGASSEDRTKALGAATERGSLFEEGDVAPISFSNDELASTFNSIDNLLESEWAYLAGDPNFMQSVGANVATAAGAMIPWVSPAFSNDYRRVGTAINKIAGENLGLWAAMLRPISNDEMNFIKSLGASPTPEGLRRALAIAKNAQIVMPLVREQWQEYSAAERAAGRAPALSFEQFAQRFGQSMDFPESANPPTRAQADQRLAGLPEETRAVANDAISRIRSGKAEIQDHINLQKLLGYGANIVYESSR